MTYILITGAGSGLGRALAMQFASANTHLVMLDISVNGLNETELSLKGLPATVDSFVVDIGDTPSLTTCLTRDILNDRTNRLGGELRGDHAHKSID